MDRRTFLGAVGVSLAGAVAGCTESGPDSDAEGGSGRNGTDSTETTPGTDGGETTAGPAETTDGPSDGSTTGAGTENGTSKPEPSTDDGPGTDGGSLAVADATFEVTNSGCGGGTNEATVSVDDDTVTVRGTIGGRNGCETARIVDATVEGGTLTVAVETYVPESEGTQGCTQCLVDIGYVATVTVEGGTPDSVAVEHGGERVTETTP